MKEIEYCGYPVGECVQREVFEELAFLRFFYSEVDGALGPASDYVYDIIKDDWRREGNKVPDEYDE